MLDGRVDVAITHEHEFLRAPPATGVRAQRDRAEPLVLTLAAGHAPARRERASLKPFSAERWIADPDASGRDAITGAACAAAGFTPDACRPIWDGPELARRLVSSQRPP